MLKVLHQAEGNEFMVVDRVSNASVIINSNFSYVNNHFWNCFEQEDGTVIIDTVAATSDYLDTYFEYKLSEPKREWDKMFSTPKRCILDVKSSSISCSNLLRDASILFDYPTFNPHYKMNSEYNWFYAIAPKDTSSSQWFDRLIKVNVRTGTI
jgi:carotenoid cleavage dioxygenase-like enzyme